MMFKFAHCDPRVFREWGNTIQLKYEVVEWFRMRGLRRLAGYDWGYLETFPLNTATPDMYVEVEDERIAVEFKLTFL